MSSYAVTLASGEGRASASVERPSSLATLAAGEKTAAYEIGTEMETGSFPLDNAGSDGEIALPPKPEREDNFPFRAYYPIAEIAALTLAQYFDHLVGEGEITTMLKMGEKDFELSSINIESLRMERRTLIFKLLPHAVEHDTQELIRRYAAMKPFLEAA